ncbi:unnamed protein product [Gadus morhua 'NCC']
MLALHFHVFSSPAASWSVSEERLDLLPTGLQGDRAGGCHAGVSMAYLQQMMSINALRQRQRQKPHVGSTLAIICLSLIRF